MSLEIGLIDWRPWPFFWHGKMSEGLQMLQEIN